MPVCGNLNDREPFLRVFLIPDAIDIAGTRVTCHLVALLFYISICFCERFIETVVWTIMFHAEHFRNSRQSLELYYTAVCTHFFNLLSVFYVYVRWSVFLVILDCKAIAGRRTFAAESLHFRPYYGVAK